MSKYRDFAPNLQLPATWTDAMEEMLSDFVGGNFKITKGSDTTVQAVAGAGDAQVSIAIDGKPRWITLTKTATVQGTPAAGLLPIWVTCHPDVFGTDVNGFEVNNTVSMDFSLVIGAPSGAGIETHSKQVGTATWDGAKITKVTQTAGVVAPPVAGVGYGNGNQVATAGGTKGALTAASDIDDLITNLSSLIADLRAAGYIGA